MQTARRQFLASIAALGLSALAGPARAAGIVNVYSYRQPELIDPLFALFTKSTGIEVRSVFAENGLVERLVRVADANDVGLHVFGGLILMGVLTTAAPVATAMVLHGFIQIISNFSRAVLLRPHISWAIIGRYLVGVIGAVLIGAVVIGAVAIKCLLA